MPPSLGRPPVLFPLPPAMPLLASRPRHKAVPAQQGDVPLVGCFPVRALALALLSAMATLLLLLSAGVLGPKATSLSAGETGTVASFGAVPTAAEATPKGTSWVREGRKAAAGARERWRGASDGARAPDGPGDGRAAVKAARKLWRQTDAAAGALFNAADEPAFLPNTKNPCWSDAQCFPFVYVLGPFQCGTDDLVARLRAHPDVVVGRTTKSHFFYEARPIAETVLHLADHASALAAPDSRAVALDASPGTFTFYLAHSADRTLKPWRESMGACHKECHGSGLGKEAGDACMDRQCFARAREAQQAAEAALGARVEVPHLVAALHGTRVRAVAMLRDPVERLHSAFYFHDHYRLHYGADPAGFHRFAHETVAVMRRCRAEAGDVRECALRFEGHGMVYEHEFFHCDQLIRGMYDVFTETWLEALPPGSLLLLKAEDYFAKPRETLEAVARHIGLDAWPAAALDAALASKRVRNADGRAGAGPGPGGSPGGTAMDASTRALLQNFYAEHNARLDAMVRETPAVLPGTRMLWGYE